MAHMIQVCNDSSKSARIITLTSVSSHVFSRAETGTQSCVGALQSANNVGAGNGGTEESERQKRNKDWRAPHKNYYHLLQCCSKRRSSVELSSAFSQCTRTAGCTFRQHAAPPFAAFKCRPTLQSDMLPLFAHCEIQKVATTCLTRGYHRSCTPSSHGNQQSPQKRESEVTVP